MSARLAALVLLLAGCSAAAPEPDSAGGGLRDRDDWVACAEPRPGMCTQEYVPVCALRAAGAECASEPCPETFERVTKSNRCTACADEAVIGWVPGACGADPVDSPLYLDP